MITGIRIALLVWLNLLAASCFAAAIRANSIDGLWQQFDDKDGQLNSLVRIETHNNKTSATIIKGYAKPNKPLDPNALTHSTTNLWWVYDFYGIYRATEANGLTAKFSTPTKAKSTAPKQLFPLMEHS